MSKDTKTGDALRADYLVKGVLKARLAGDLKARRMSTTISKRRTKSEKKVQNYSCEREAWGRGGERVREYVGASECIGLLAYPIRPNPSKPVLMIEKARQLLGPTTRPHMSEI